LPAPKHELSERASEILDLFLTVGGHKPGHLEWRIYVERRCGGNKNVIRHLKQAKSVLQDIRAFGVWTDTASKLEKVADELENSLTDQPRNAESRFRWILGDMIARIDGAPSEELGAFEVRIEEAAGLAILLNFESVPIQRISCDREGESVLYPWLGRVWPNPWMALFLKDGSAKYSNLFGFRLHDPVPGTFPTDFFVSGIGSPVSENPGRAVETVSDKPKFKKNLVAHLHHWLRDLDGRPVKAEERESGDLGKQTSGTTLASNSVPDAKGYVADPVDPSAYVPLSEIKAKYCDTTSIATIKQIVNIIENHSANEVRWTRPLTKAGVPDGQRRSIHFGDWGKFLQRFKNNSWETEAFPPLKPGEFENRKTEVRRDRGGK